MHTAPDWGNLGQAGKETPRQCSFHNPLPLAYQARFNIMTGVLAVMRSHTCCALGDALLALCLSQSLSQKQLA